MTEGVTLPRNPSFRSCRSRTWRRVRSRTLITATAATCPTSSRLTSADVSTPCVTILPAAQVKALDPCSTASCSGAPGFVSAGPAPVLLGLFKNRYPTPNDYNVGDGINTAGVRFNAPDPLIENGYVARVDYVLNSSNRIFGRFNVRNEKTVNDNVGVLPIQFPGDSLTALETLRDRAWVIGETWTIGPNAINQFTYGETRANDQFPIQNNQAGGLYELTFFGSSQGDSFATPYVRQSASGRVVPDPTYRDDVTYIHGKHTFQFGGELNPLKIRSNLVNDLTFIQEGLGGAITRARSELRMSQPISCKTLIRLPQGIFDRIFPTRRPRHYLELSRRL